MKSIIELAREAGFVPHYTRPQDAIVRKGYALSGELKGYKAAMQDIERFAALVRAEDEALLRQALEALRKAHANAGNAEAVYQITKAAIAKVEGEKT